ncbi:hypothetical protein HanIR_Chr14g0684721 [Helianthus annuus]|nr:hypothetical protein HanIR_Chr14g0684721 [Helianthus annuus]
MSCTFCKFVGTDIIFLTRVHLISLSCATRVIFLLQTTITKLQILDLEREREKAIYERGSRQPNGEQPIRSQPTRPQVRNPMLVTIPHRRYSFVSRRRLHLFSPLNFSLFLET